MLKYIITLVCICFFLFNGKSQVKTVQGSVKDSAGNPIAFVNITVNRNKNTVAYSTSNNAGYFNIKIEDTAKVFTVQANAMGYALQQTAINFTGANSITCNFILLAEAIQLTDVTVKSSTVVISKDTIKYDADAFTNKTETNVEDVLKKIPGVEVDDKGKISVNGQDISKLMVEGDDIAGRNYTTITKNMPANTVSQVQVLKNYEDNPLLKNFMPNNRKVAINIKLRKGLSLHFFGTAEAGLNTKAHYTGKLNLLSLTGKLKFYSLTTANNVGVTPINDVEDLYIFVNADGTPQIQEFEPSVSGKKITNIVPDKDNLLDERYANFNKTFLSSANFIYRPIENLKIKINPYVVTDKNNSFNYNSAEYLLNDSVLKTYDSNYYTAKPVSFITESSVEYQINPKHRVVYTGFFKTNSNNQFATTTSNFSNNIFQKLNNTDNKIDERINYSWRINQSSIFLAGADYMHNHIRQPYFIQPGLYDNLFNGSYDRFKQFYENQKDYAGAELQYIFYKKKHYLQIKLLGEYDKDYLSSNIVTYLKDTAQIQSNEFANNDVYKKFLLHSYLKYNYSIGLFDFTFFAHEIHINANYNSQTNGLVDTVNQSWKIAPQGTIRFKSQNQLHSITLSYGNQYTLPEMSQIYEGLQLSSYRTFLRSKTAYTISQTNKLSLNYAYGTITNFFKIAAGVSYEQTKDSYLNNYLLSNTFSITELLPATKPQNKFNSFFSISKFYPSISANFSLNAAYGITSFQDELSSLQLRDIQSNFSSIQFSSGSAFKGLFNYYFKSNFYTNKSIIKEQNTNNDESLSSKGNKSTVGLIFKLSKSLSAKFNNNYFFINNQNSKTNYFLSDVTLKQIIKKNVSEIQFTAFNIFNTQKIDYITISGLQKNISSFNLQPLYLMVEFKYVF